MSEFSEKEIKKISKESSKWMMEILLEEIYETFYRANFRYII
jgi:hypothetical protein